MKVETNQYKYIAPLEYGGAVYKEPMPQSSLQKGIAYGALVGGSLAFIQYNFVGLLIPTPLVGFWFWADKLKREFAERELLTYYAAIRQPIFVFSEHPTDRTVMRRAEMHRRLLFKSGNELYKQGLLPVEEIYYRDPARKFTETFDEFELHRPIHIENFINEWTKRHNYNDRVWAKIYLLNQEKLENEN